MKLKNFIQDQLTGTRNITSTEAAKYLGITRENLDTLVQNGIIKPTAGGGAGKTIYFAVDDVQILRERLQEYR